MASAASATASSVAGVEVLDTLDADRIREVLNGDELLWVELRDPSQEDVARAGELFGLHPLAIEDTQHFGQLPKLDDYPGSVLLVFYGAHENDAGLPEPAEIHIYITAQAVLTVRRCDLPGLDDACRRVREREVKTSEEALYRVLHALAESFIAPLRTLENELDELEDRALDDPDPQMRQRLLAIKHSLLRVRQVVDPQRDVLASRRDVIESLPGFTDDMAHDYLRDVHDHLARTTQQVESVRELVANALDLYLSTVSNRLNEVMKRLTVVATIFLPLTFVTGFFGMNFGWMVDHIKSPAVFWLLGVGTSLVSGLSMWAVSARLERAAAAQTRKRRHDFRRRSSVRDAGDPPAP